MVWRDIAARGPRPGSQPTLHRPQGRSIVHLQLARQEWSPDAPTAPARGDRRPRVSPRRGGPPFRRVPSQRPSPLPANLDSGRGACGERRPTRRQPRARRGRDRRGGPRIMACAKPNIRAARRSRASAAKARPPRSARVDRRPPAARSFRPPPRVAAMSGNERSRRPLAAYPAPGCRRRHQWLAVGCRYSRAPVGRSFHSRLRHAQPQAERPRTRAAEDLSCLSRPRGDSATRGQAQPGRKPGTRRAAAASRASSRRRAGTSGPAAPVPRRLRCRRTGRRRQFPPRDSARATKRRRCRRRSGGLVERELDAASTAASAPTSHPGPAPRLRERDGRSGIQVVGRCAS